MFINKNSEYENIKAPYHAGINRIEFHKRGCSKQILHLDESLILPLKHQYIDNPPKGRSNHKEVTFSAINWKISCMYHT